MSKHNLQKLELTWIGKGNAPHIGHRILLNVLIKFWQGFN